MLTDFTEKDLDYSSKMSRIYRILVSSTFTNLEIRREALEREVSLGRVSYAGDKPSLSSWRQRRAGNGGELSR